MRGGARPGAGAPKGNLNRLTTGVRSKQIQEAIARALGFPERGQGMLFGLTYGFGVQR